MGEGPIVGICVDGSRCGCCLYNGISVQFVADRRDIADPFKGLDIFIQRNNPKTVIVSIVQKRLITFLEKRFRMQVIDLATNLTIRKSTVANTGSSIRNEKVQFNDPVVFNMGPSGTSSRTRVEASTISTHEPSEMETETSVNMMEVNPINQSNLSDTSLSDSEDIMEPVEINDYVFSLIIVPNIWFSMAKGYQQLVESELVDSRNLQSQEDRVLFVATKVDKAIDTCAVRSLGAIYSFMEKYLNRTPNEDSGIVKEAPMNSTQCSSFKQSQNSFLNKQIIQQKGTPTIIPRLMNIHAIKYIDSGPVLSLDKYTLKSLSILNGSRSKYRSNVNKDPDLEIIPTLYELLNQCSSLQGKRQLHTIMMWPLQDSIQIRNRLDLVAFFMRNENIELRERLYVQLKNVIPLHRILFKMNDSLLNYNDLSGLYKSLVSFVAVIEIIINHGTYNMYLLDRLADIGSQDLKIMMEYMINLIDFEQSQRERVVQVCQGVDQSVDEKRNIVANMVKLCSDTATRETTKYKNQLGKLLKAVYVPRIGFLLSFDYNSLTEVLNLKSNPEFDVMLHTENSIYFKTPGVLEMDKLAGDVACDLIDVQQVLLLKLQTELLKFSDTLLLLVELCGELDCLLAFSTVSQQRGFTKPDIVESRNELDIKGGYHAIHSLQANIVPNDVKYSRENLNESVRVMIITGPNSCGKTTYMKSTCLIIYMAHIGCFVPADYAQIPVTDAILTRMTYAHSISTGLSSFASDLHQVQYAISRATEKSFIAIDEFGCGTRARDGFHLLKAVIMYFANRGRESPYIMFSSHFTKIIDHLERYTEYIAYRTFIVTRNLVNNTISYSYKIINGVGEHTLADEVAKRAGLPQALVDRAKEIRELMLQNRAVSQRQSSPRAA